MKVVSSAIETRNVVQTCYGNELMKNLLPHLTEQLELCQKSLTAGPGRSSLTVCSYCTGVPAHIRRILLPGLPTRYCSPRHRM